MNESSYPDVESLCRLCLEEHKDAFAIFAEDDSQLSIPMRIISCVSLEAKTTDGLPKKICSECRYQLEKSYMFRQRSQLSDKKLRKHLRLVSQGKKSRVFVKSQDDEEDEMEFEDSIAFINEQEKVREIKIQEWRENVKKEIKDDFDKQLDASRKQLRTQITEKLRKEIRQELFDEVQEECRKEQLAKLVGELEVFLAEKKAGMWEDLETAPIVDVQSENAAEIRKSERSRKRPCSQSPKPHVSQCFKMEEAYEDETQPMNLMDDSADAEGDHEGDVDMSNDNARDIQEIGVSSDGEIFIINGAEQKESTPEDTTTNFSLSNDITSYNIKDNGEIQYSGSKESTQEENVVVLNLQNDLDEELQLSDYEQNVFILPHDVGEETPRAKKLKKEDLVLKQVTNPPEQGAVKAGRVTDTLKTFRCQLCPIEFPTEKSWTRHLNTHIKTLKNGKSGGYKCPVCGLQLSCASSLKRHMVIHTGMKPHKCEECGQSFVQREVLKRHMDTHTGEKRHQCPHCASRFAQKTNLQQHIAKVHLDNPQKHQCHLCQRNFSHVSGLSRHLVTHAGILFACKECGRQFTDRSSIKRHVHSVHNIKDKLVDIYVSEAETVVS